VLSGSCVDPRRSPILPPWGAPRYYRVKVKNGLTGLDSSWSNVVKVEPPKAQRLPAPKLEMKPDFLLGTTSWKWTSVTGATGYVLQNGHDVAFSNTVEIYSGEKTEHTARTRGISTGSILSAGTGRSHRPSAPLSSGVSNSIG
jgi:hypothetical protein